MYIYINLERYQFDELFCDIHSRGTFLKVKLKVLEYLQMWTGNKAIVHPYVCIDFENLHRAFLVNQDGHKIISFAFDFTVKTESPDYTKDNLIRSIHYYSTYGKIEPRNISEAQTILSEYSSSENKTYNELGFDDEDNIAPESYRLFEFLLFREDGYIRYDYDVQGYKPRLHPINHFDVNYSEPSHYKIGLEHKIDVNGFMSVVDKKEPCAVLETKPANKSTKKYKKKGGRRKRK